MFGPSGVSMVHRVGHSGCSERHEPQSQHAHGSDHLAQVRRCDACASPPTERVGLVHELRQLVGAEETVDHRAQRLGIDQVCRREHLVVADIHAFADGASHPCESDPKLAEYSCSPTVRIRRFAQVVDVVHIGVRCSRGPSNVLDDANDVVRGERVAF